MEFFIMAVSLALTVFILLALSPSDDDGRGY